MQEKLVGLTLTGVTLAKGTTGFEISGVRDGSSYRFSLSTMYQVCFSREDIFERDIINDPSSLKIWKILEHDVKAIQLSEDQRYCEIHFEDAPLVCPRKTGP